MPAKTYGSCSGCRTKIVNKKLMNFSACKLRYDLICANINAEDFDSMDLEFKHLEMSRLRSQTAQIRQY